MNIIARMLQQAVTNQIPFRYVLNDVWYASAENMSFVKQTLHKDFIMPLKANRKVAVSVDGQAARALCASGRTGHGTEHRAEIYLEGVEFPAPADQASLRKRRWQ